VEKIAGVVKVLKCFRYSRHFRHLNSKSMAKMAMTLPPILDSRFGCSLEK
jgi:hypothetical protein